MKKFLSILLIVMLLFTGCKSSNNTEAATEAPTDEAVVTAEADATPTAEPTASPDDEKSDDEGTDDTIVDDEKDDDDSSPEYELYEIENNTAVELVEEPSRSFDGANAVSDTVWSGSVGSPKVEISNDGYSGKCLKFYPNGVSYSTAAVDLAKIIKDEGLYCISFKYRFEGTGEAKAMTVIRSNELFSFTDKNGGNFYRTVDTLSGDGFDTWYDYEATLTVLKSDIKSGAVWNFCFHNISTGITSVSVDNFSVTKLEYNALAKAVTKAETWVMNEAVFLSDSSYDDPVNDVELNLVLTKGNIKYTVPAFWDGGNIWRARFVCTEPGTWQYKTVCSDKSNGGLNNQTSTVTCTEYSGSLAIYKHGFVTTDSNKRYFIYDDGTPFFYLGDTHWGLGTESLSMVKTIVKKRASQDFTVFQSEPIGASYNVADGISTADIAGFKAYDEKFNVIANAGLVHANASFFFVSTMTEFINNNGGFGSNKVDAVYKGSAVKAYDLSTSAKLAIRTVCRYWVARYGAYPVMWTLAQECDSLCTQKDGSYYVNPWLTVAEYINGFDAYKHPLSAHMWNVRTTKASQSDFRNCSAHTWYAAQWKQSYNGTIDLSYPKDFYNNGQGKPTVNYEGNYCYLYSKNFGARLQGYMAFLNGMCGYGWGGQDTWCYKNTYSEDKSSSDGCDTVTSADKKNATWQDALEYESTYQMQYMRSLFENKVGDWWNLIPRFDDTAYFAKANSNVFYMYASNADNSKGVIYFYNFSDSSVAETPNASAANGKLTGTVKNLQKNTTYNYLWFNPITGSVVSSGSFTSTSSGTWSIGNKASCDMVLYLYK